MMSRATGSVSAWPAAPSTPSVCDMIRSISASERSRVVVMVALSGPGSILSMVCIAAASLLARRWCWLSRGRGSAAVGAALPVGCGSFLVAAAVLSEEVEVRVVYFDGDGAAGLAVVLVGFLGDGALDGEGSAGGPVLGGDGFGAVAPGFALPVTGFALLFPGAVVVAAVGVGGESEVRDGGSVGGEVEFDWFCEVAVDGDVGVCHVDSPYLLSL